MYLFLLWSEARREEGRILADIAAHFTILDLVEVAWTPDETFARSLSRMYGDDLPPNSDKEVHCGTGPFLVAVVEDQRPSYRVRRTNRGPKLLNSSVFDARRRYRQWTGGGHRVHASDSMGETRRNLALLFGKRVEDFRGRRAVVGEAIRRVDADLVGTDGWASLEQLELALQVHGGRVMPRSADSDRVQVVASDLWWMRLIAGGREIEPGILDVRVGGKAVELALRERASGVKQSSLALLGRLRCQPPVVRPREGVDWERRRRIRFVRDARGHVGCIRVRSVLKRLWRLRHMPWYYRRPATTGAVASVAVLGTLLARALLPRSWRPSGGGWLLVGSAGAYAALRLGSYTGLSKRFKHTYLDWFGGDVDDAQTWMLAGLGGGGVLVLAQSIRRALAPDGSRGRAEPRQGNRLGSEGHQSQKARFA